MNKEQAIKAVRVGALAAFGVGGFTLAAVLYALFSNKTEGLWSVWNDPSNFADIGLVVFCGVALLRRSRAAAVVLVVYFILTRMLIWDEHPTALTPLSLSIAAILLFVFARAIQGTFKFHKLEKEHNPQYHSPSKWYYIVGIPVGVIGLALVTLLILSTANIIPSASVIPGQKLSTSNRTFLTDNGIISADETVEYFYSEGFFSIKKGGSILTDKRTICYWQEDGEVRFVGMIFDEITNIELIEEGDPLSDSVVKVINKEGSGCLLVLSTENQGHVKFINSLKQKASVNPAPLSQS